MDGYTIIAVAGTVAGFSIPSYYALSKIYYRLGLHEERLNGIDNKLEKINNLNKINMKK